ncbi:HET-domain-containing protein [Cucurbitaria berberidis CBS 394.84]|uniref:HET-domain-containing protein n=1 Tax=Cucurbitaria berberidis CBS 394.84 TaxID=1168544 RepID=A0A9P4GLW2_9PLEO|nr:HET-domain-containing protein [Cucurbitaria berberidis CBS 394.84]KAF1848773.1 HET-domain-containing protein [Cucurbitaria berberidis CBS 394.84]
MATYKYAPLKHQECEIRLVTLRPGQWNDDIAFTICHTPLIRPKDEEHICRRLSVQELNQTLPNGYRCGETLNGRYLFMQEKDGANSWELGMPMLPQKDILDSWYHPDPNFDPALYEVQSRRPGSDSRPEYEALSYTWSCSADPVIAHELSATPSTMKIRANLALALRYLRYLDKPRNLWIDAICINQNDISERNREISRMRDIYSLATRTILWVGGETSDSAKALATLEYFGEQVECLGGGQCADTPGTTQLGWFQTDCELPYDEQTWSSLVAFFQRPWFTRVWVLQEAILGGERCVIQCGKDTALFYSLRKTMLVMARNTTVPAALRSLLSSYRPGLLPSSIRSFAGLVSWTRDHHCTDPRDKIYGILGLVSPSIAQGITTNYLLPTSRIYERAFLSCVLSTGRLHLLQQCRLSQQLYDGPSWLPNFAVKDSSATFELELGRHASGLAAAHAKYFAPDTLEVLGFNGGAVVLVSMESSSNAKDIFRAIRRAVPGHCNSSSYVAGGSLLDAYLESGFQGQTRDRYPKFRFPSFQSLQSNYHQHSSHHTEHVEFNINTLGQEIENVVFFTTQDGYVGLTPTGVAEGDCVSILLGADYPILLRPTMSGEYFVVGPCYIHGLMSGEALLGPIPNPWQIKMYRGYSSGWLTLFSQPPNVKTFQDPRLSPLSSQWKEVGGNDDGPPIAPSTFQNTNTGKVIDSDPRMLPNGLERRGVKLEKFRLI